MGKRTLYVGASLLIAYILLGSLFIMPLGLHIGVRGEKVRASHGSIYINGNADFTSANGVSNPGAAGTEADPFIIEDWEIDSSGYGISIEATTAYFIIRGCTINCDGEDGVKLSYVENGSIEDCTIEGGGMIKLYYNCKNNSILNNIIEGSTSGDRGAITIYDGCSYNEIKANSIINSDWSGIHISKSEDNIFHHNTISNCIYAGIRVKENSQSISIFHNTISDCSIGVDSGHSDILNISNNLISLCDNSGICLHDGSQVEEISDNTINNCNSNGIQIDGSHDTIIANNDIYDNSEKGIGVVNSNNVDMSYNTVYNNDADGIDVDNSDNAGISYNTVYDNNEDGIEVGDSDYAVVNSNIVTGNEGKGLGLSNSLYSRVVENEFSDDGMMVFGSDISQFICHVFEDNVVNGKSLVVIKNQSGLDMDCEDAGAVLILNSTDIEIFNGRFEQTDIGVSIAYSETVIVTDCLVSKCDWGIGLMAASQTTLHNCTIMKNDVGAIFFYSDNNLIYNNNFLDNTEQVDFMTTSTGNSWNTAYPTGGNHWDDYYGNDQFSGSSQDIPGSDGIGDSPYNVHGTDYDDYPYLLPLPSPFLDLIPPTVTEVIPANNVKKVSPLQDIVVMFSETINTNTTPQINVGLGNDPGNWTLAKWENINNTNDTMTWSHDPFEMGDTIQVQVSGYYDMWGNVGLPHIWSFTVVLDTDNDGIPDDVDEDDDGDGMPDSWEEMYSLDPKNGSDALQDSDGDGLTNLEEYENGTSPVSPDTDSDGMPDGWEIENGLNPSMMTDALTDSDGDGLNNYEEYLNGTSPKDSDTDGDGMPDGWEVEYGLDPLDISDRNGDPDGDGYSNIQEYLNGTDPTDESDFPLPDTDGDGIPDMLDDDDDNDGWNDTIELQCGTDPLDNTSFPSDFDGDGIPDMLDDDDDNDGWNDTIEASCSTDPLDNMSFPSDFDGDLIPDLLDDDDDNDGMPDDWELTYGLDPKDSKDASEDTDEDGLTNLQEYYNGTAPNNADTDEDKMPDGWEIANELDPLASTDAQADEDKDNLTNLEEYQYGTSPMNDDTDGDRMPDGWEVGYGLDPLRDDSNEDPDQDGCTNYEEYVRGTSPVVSDKKKEKEKEDPDPTWLIIAVAAIVIALAAVGLFAAHRKGLVKLKFGKKDTGLVKDRIHSYISLNPGETVRSISTGADYPLKEVERSVKELLDDDRIKEEEKEGNKIYFEKE